MIALTAQAMLADYLSSFGVWDWLLLVGLVGVVAFGLDIVLAWGKLKRSTVGDGE